MNEDVGVTWSLLELGVGPEDTGDLGIAFHSRGESEAPSHTHTHSPTSTPAPCVPQESPGVWVSVSGPPIREQHQVPAPTMRDLFSSLQSGGKPSAVQRQLGDQPGGRGTAEEEGSGEASQRRGWHPTLKEAENMPGRGQRARRGCSLWLERAVRGDKRW